MRHRLVADTRRPSAVLRTALLVLLAEEASHGYDLGDRLAELGLVADRSAVYRTLRSMDRCGDLRSVWCASERGPARRVYEVTEAGRTLLQRGLDGMTVHRVTVERVLHRSRAAAV